MAEGVDRSGQAVVRDYTLSEALLKAGRDAGRLSELGGTCALCGLCMFACFATTSEKL